MIPVPVCLPACFVLYPPCFQDGRFSHQEYFQVTLRRFPFTKVQRLAQDRGNPQKIWMLVKYFKTVMIVEWGIHFTRVVMETMTNDGYIVCFTIFVV